MGNRIKERREKLGMTQEDLAQASGISRATISALESGVEKNTTTKTLLAIADALKTTVDRLFFARTV